MKKILVIIDMQNDFIDGPLGTAEAQAIVPNVIEKIKSADEETLILFTKDAHDENYFETQEGKNLPVKHCIKNSGGWCINKEIRSEWLTKLGTVSVTFLKNNTFEKGTFGSVDLCNFISVLISDYREDIEEIELIGVCTDICVISNALILKAYVPEVKISVDATCCAGVTPERHRIALEAMKACQINVKE